MAFSILEEVEKLSGLLDAKQVAALFKIKAQTVYEMAASKDIPSFKLGGSLRFDPRSLGYWLRKKDPTLAKAMRAEG